MTTVEMTTAPTHIAPTDTAATNTAAMTGADISFLETIALDTRARDRWRTLAGLVCPRPADNQRPRSSTSTTAELTVASPSRVRLTSWSLSGPIG